MAYAMTERCWGSCDSCRISERRDCGHTSPAKLDGEFYGASPLELPAKAGSSRILQSVSLRLTAPLKGSLWILHRLKPPLEGRWRAQRDGEVLEQLRFLQGFPTTLAGTDAQCAPLRVRCTIEPRCRGRDTHRPVPTGGCGAIWGRMFVPLGRTQNCQNYGRGICPSRCSVRDDYCTAAVAMVSISAYQPQ